MAILEKEMFSFTWRIANFSMCLHRFSKCIESPSFSVDFLGNTTWKLLMYPSGDGFYRDCVVFHLKKAKKDDLADIIEFKCTLTLISAGMQKKVVKQIVNLDTGVTERQVKYIHRLAVLNSENGLLPNDTLTVICQLWRDSEEPKNTFPFVKYEIVSSGINTDPTKCNGPLKVLESSARTRIRARSEYVLWPIKRFSAIKPNEELKKMLTFNEGGEELFILTFCLKGESPESQCVHIDIRRAGTHSQARGIFVRCKINALGVPDTKLREKEDGYYFEGKQDDEVWKFPAFIKTKKIFDEEYLYYMNDTIHLHFEFKISVEGEEYQSYMESVQAAAGTQLETSQYCKEKYYQQLHPEKNAPDLIIRNGVRTYDVHKSVLSSKSPVFSIMLASDMMEKANGIVEITDLDPDIVDRMLLFMYTDVLEDVDSEKAAGLYIAADKYRMTQLKCRCCSILMSTLSSSSVCKVLRIAELFEDEVLLEAARSFTFSNAEEVFHLRDWKDFMEHSVQLAAAVMHDVIVKKLLV